ncbi:MAG TPA: TerC family protein [Candidatus Thermoplasmatota archaeon]|nr:TerC family protein [Candidatus Thermoplasmatota archaeon]
MLDLLSDPAIWVAFLTLTALEMVLGIDNVVFISILADKLPAGQRAKARRVGLALAMLLRIALVMSVAWIVGLTEPVFTLLDHGVSWRDLVLIVGGLFLLGKATHEIHGALEGAQGHASARVPASFPAVIAQILALDLVFSIDSVITAVGLTDIIPVMVAAVMVAVAAMMVAAGPIGSFVSRHPTVKMLALSFLLMIGGLLVAEGFGQHIPHGYIYFAMAFSLGVEMLNIRLRKVAPPVELHSAYVEPGEAPKA